MTLEALGLSTRLLGPVPARFGAAGKATSITAIVKRYPFLVSIIARDSRLVDNNVVSVYDLNVFVMGRFQITETMTSSPVRNSRHVTSRRPRLGPGLGPLSVLLVAFGAYFGPALTQGASARAGPPPQPLQIPEMRQYHGIQARQYHLITRSSAPALASLSRSSELTAAISTVVISRLFTSRSPNSTPTIMIHTPFQQREQIGARNDRSIGVQIGAENGRDPRVMLDIAAALGLVYLAFLAVWFWATRVRMRPPRSAPS